MNDDSKWFSLRGEFYAERNERNTSIYLTLGIKDAKSKYLLWTIDAPLSASQCEMVLNYWFQHQDFLILQKGVTSDG